MELILASGSKARLAMLRSAGVAVAAHPARVDEDAIRAGMIAEGALPRDIADTLAEAKARKVSGKHPGALVLGCDQILGLGKQVLSKSDTRDAAHEVLTRLRGQRHQLYSAAVLYRDGEPIWRHVGIVRMQARNFSDAYLDGYLDRNWPAVSDAVGCYHLEGEGVRLFSRVEGDYFTVLGLPLIELLGYLTLRGELES